MFFSRRTKFSWGFVLILSQCNIAAAWELIYTANRQGEIEPCGCQGNPVGGLGRLATYVSEARKKGEVLFVDSGDTFFSSNKPAPIRAEFEKRRALLIADTYQLVGAKYFTPGERDFAAGEEFLVELTKKAGFKVLSANLKSSRAEPWISSWELVELGGEKIALTGISSEELQKNPGIRVEDPLEALKKIVKEMKEKNPSRILILSHLGLSGDRALASTVPGTIVLGSHSMDFLADPEKIEGSLIFQPTIEGQEIGSLLFSASGPPIHKQVPLGADFEIDAIVHKLTAAFYENNRRLAQNELSGKSKIDDKGFVANPHKCKSCHQEQFAFWEKTKHASAYLVLYARNQHFDPECIGCHSLGFQQIGGFEKIAEPLVLTKDKKGKTPFVETFLETVFKGDGREALDSRADPLRHAKLHERWVREMGRLAKAGSIKKNYLGIQCEHCHDNRSIHISQGIKIGKKVQTETCLACHRAPNAPEFKESMVSLVACPRMKGRK